MAILIDEKTKFLIQGITGKQGQKTCQSMLKDNANIVAGVTPGKGGQHVENIPVYNSINEAKQHHEIDCSVILVPPRFAKSAIIEAIKANIPLIDIITENIPIHDIVYCLQLAKEKDIKIVGPSSVGIFSIDKSKCGPIAGGESSKAFSKGNIGVISKSGGMCSETSLVIKQAGLGQSTVIGIGGDVLRGEDFVSLIKLFEKDNETKGVVIFGEIGGTAEEDLAEYLIKRKQEHKKYLKPIVAFISGEFTKKFQNISLGHAGAIIEGNKGTRENKINKLKEAGVIIAEVHHKVGELIKNEISN